MERLASINPLVKPEPRRTHKTACGTIMAGTILPAFVILYSLLWLRAFYANGDGSIETTTILPIDFTMGIRMDNRVDHLDPRPSGQKFKCTAASGCWYTVFFDPVDVNVPDGKCPPRQVKQGIAFSAAEAAQNFAGVNAGAPGAGDTVPPNQAPTINKKVRLRRAGRAPRRRLPLLHARPHRLVHCRVAGRRHTRIQNGRRDGDGVHQVRGRARRSRRGH